MRIVVKIGSSSLVDAAGMPRTELLDAIAGDIAHVLADRNQVVLVSSGAIATGLGLLGVDRRPTELPALQAASAVGQGALFAAWAERFEANGLRAAQVLLTMHDASHRTSWVNARATLEQLLGWGVVPVVNENDTTATDEITFGDNDALAAQVAGALGVDRLLLLTDTDGLYTEHPDAPGAELIRTVEDHSLLRRVDTATSGSHWGSGGMRSKVVAAEMASASGAVTYIARASEPGVVARVVAGDVVGTRIAAGIRSGTAYKLWLRHAKRAQGRIDVDQGARRALEERGASLLVVGVVGVDGAFHAGDAVDVCLPGESQPFAKGIVEYGSDDLARRVGAGGDARGTRAAIHRDQLVLLEQVSID